VTLPRSDRRTERPSRSAICVSRSAASVVALPSVRMLCSLVPSVALPPGRLMLMFFSCLLRSAAVMP
jgi:hypothetical protein